MIKIMLVKIKNSLNFWHSDATTPFKTSNISKTTIQPSKIMIKL